VITLLLDSQLTACAVSAYHH